MGCEWSLECENQGEGWKKGKMWSSPTTLVSYGINLEKNWTVTQVKETTRSMLTKVFNRLHALKDENATLKTKFNKLQTAVICGRTELGEKLTKFDIRTLLDKWGLQEPRKKEALLRGNGKSTMDLLEGLTDIELAKKPYNFTGTEIAKFKEGIKISRGRVTTKVATCTASLWTAEDIEEVRALLEKWGIQESTKKAALLCEDGWDDIDLTWEELTDDDFKTYNFTDTEITNFRAGVKKYLEDKSKK